MSAAWRLQPIFDSYLLVAAIAVGLAGLLWVVPGFGQLDRRRRRWLTILRAALVFLVVLAMLQPSLVSTKKRVQTSTLVVLLDASRSMTVPDAASGTTRWQAMIDTLRQAMPQLADMGENFDVELLAFSDAVVSQPIVDGKLRLEARPESGQTDIGSCLAETLKLQLGKRLAAVVLMSDGAQRAYSPKIEPQQAARELARRAAPLYTIPFGRSRDQTQSRDVAIDNLQDQYTVYVKNEFQLRGGIRIQGYVGQSIPVRLKIEDPEGEIEELGPLQLEAGRDSQQVTAEFTYIPQQVGQHKLTLQADEQPGEMVVDNNRLSAFLNVLDGGMRALLLTSSLLHQEQRMLRRTLDESPDIQLDFQAIDVRTQDQWPLDLASDLELQKYDIFIVGDLDSGALTADSWKQLAQLVENGKGLMMFGGYHSFGPGGYRETALRDVLPIEMGQFERQLLDPTAPVRTDLHLTGPIQMLPTGDDAITHLAAGDDNRAIWESLQPLNGANRLGRVKDQATVIAAGPPSPDSPNRPGPPLLVKSNYVSGRVLAFAGNSTYQWWRYGRKDVHKRFWRQAILWLASRDQTQTENVWIMLPQRRFRPGSRVDFTAGVNDASGVPLADATLTAEIQQMTSGEKTTIDLIPREGQWTGSFNKTAAPGDYRLVVRAARGGQELDERHADFVVLDQDLELSDPAANPALLEMLAKLTEQAGGKTLAPEQLPELLRTIKASPPEDQIETQSKRQLGDTAVDAWGFFLVLVALMSSEWYLRKRWGLV